MKEHKNLDDLVIGCLGKDYVIHKNDIGSDAEVSAKGMTFTIDSYEAENLGHLCVIGMNGMLGMMKMETGAEAYVRDIEYNNGR